MEITAKIPMTHRKVLIRWKEVFTIGTVRLQLETIRETVIIRRNSILFDYIIL